MMPALICWCMTSTHNKYFDVPFVKEKISWVDKISNEEVLQRVNETKTMLDTVRKRNMVRACAKTWIITALYNWRKNEGEGYTR